jgi:hypothetical protein
LGIENVEKEGRAGVNNEDRERVARDSVERTKMERENHLLNVILLKC